MTENEKRLCHLTARALRIMTIQDDAEADGDHDLVGCLDAALGRLAMEAQRITVSIAEPAGHDMGDINSVVAALIPGEGMTITSAQSAWYVAQAEKCRAELVMDGAETLLEIQNDIKAKVYTSIQCANSGTHF